MNVLVCTCMYCVVLDKMCDVQAHTIQSAGTVCLDINPLKPRVLSQTRVSSTSSCNSIASASCASWIFPSRLVTVGIRVQDQPPSTYHYLIIHSCTNVQHQENTKRLVGVEEQMERDQTKCAVQVLCKSAPVYTST